MQNYSLFLVLDRKSLIESESLLLSLIIGIIIIMTNSIFAQAQQDNEIGVKIISPITGQQVPVGELTITGTSTDDATTGCQVYVDLNDQKPFQKAIATGPGGESDYSKWNYNYTRNYNTITEGTNELTAKLSCFDDSNIGTTTNVTKWNSVNVTGGSTTTLTKPESTTLTKPEDIVPPFIFSMPPVE